MVLWRQGWQETYRVWPELLLYSEAADWESWCKTYAPYWHAAVEGSCCESLSFWKQIHNKLLKLMFHGYRIHTRTSLFTTSFHLNPCMCMFVRIVSFWNRNIPIPCMPLFVQLYLSFPPIPNTGMLPAAQILPAPCCVHTLTSMNPHALWISIFLLLPH